MPKGHGNVADIASPQRHHDLVHISGDRTRALAVSIPRDTKMMLPTCKTTGGGTARRLRLTIQRGHSTTAALGARSVPSRVSAASPSITMSWSISLASGRR